MQTSTTDNIPLVSVHFDNFEKNNLGFYFNNKRYIELACKQVLGLDEIFKSIPSFELYLDDQLQYFFSW